MIEMGVTTSKTAIPKFMVNERDTQFEKLRRLYQEPKDISLKKNSLIANLEAAKNDVVNWAGDLIAISKRFSFKALPGHRAGIGQGSFHRICGDDKVGDLENEYLNFLTKYNLPNTMKLVSTTSLLWADSLANNGDSEKLLTDTQHFQKNVIIFSRRHRTRLYAEFAIREALARIFLGRNHDENVLVILENIEKEAKRVLSSDLGIIDEQAWQAVLARVYSTWGYLYRVQRKYSEAKVLYEHAITLWEMLGTEKELASTLNNLGYVLALLGDFGLAKQYVNRALETRQKLHEPTGLTLSFTTLASIEMMTGNYQAALDLSERALSLAQTSEYQRGEGLAQLGIAVACRHLAKDNNIVITQKKKYLGRALETCRLSCKIFLEVAEEERWNRSTFELNKITLALNLLTNS